jgi:SAM-dependent methyltransferase
MRRTTAEQQPYLERGDGIKDIQSDSIDIVLFCEIIEHLTFNPIPMWKEIYRVMKPGGKIIVTTPNANFWFRLADNVDRILSKRGWGVTVEHIMTQGTHGHHWKEFTKSEIAEYFSFLSKDFLFRNAFWPAFMDFTNLGRICHLNSQTRFSMTAFLPRLPCATKHTAYPLILRGKEPPPSYAAFGRCCPSRRKMRVLDGPGRREAGGIMDDGT